MTLVFLAIPVLFGLALLARRIQVALQRRRFYDRE